MNQKSKAISNLLKNIADKIENLNNEQIKMLENNKFDIYVEFNDSPSHTKYSDFNKKLTTHDLNDIIGKLNSIKTREEGHKYIDELNLSKNKLIDVARFLDIPVQQKENMQIISDKIIENTIGYKLRSQAIQGTNKENSYND
jgi:ribulose bisphosphate carboxylase small subunit